MACGKQREEESFFPAEIMSELNYRRKREDLLVSEPDMQRLGLTWWCRAVYSKCSGLHCVPRRAGSYSKVKSRLGPSQFQITRGKNEGVVRKYWIKARRKPSRGLSKSCSPMAYVRDLDDQLLQLRSLYHTSLSWAGSALLGRYLRAVAPLTLSVSQLHTIASMQGLPCHIPCLCGSP